MQRIVFSTILLAICFVFTTKGVKLRNCTNKKLEINANSPGHIICNNITKNGSVVWRHGQEAVLGECKADGNCSSYFPNKYNLTREANSTDSHLQFLANATADYGANISCEDRQSGAIDTCTLDIKGVQIANCRSEKLVIFENSTHAISCKIIPANGTVIWRLGEKKTFIGDCNALGDCFNNMSASYNISRKKDSAVSHLIIHENLRGLLDARITCEDESGQTSDTCQLVIRRPPVLHNCTITTNNTTETVSGHCIVDEFFSSDNNTQCQWTMRNTSNKDADHRQDQLMSNVSFNYTCKRRRNCWGTCNFTSPLPHNKGVYIYTIMVLDFPNATFSLNITINGSNDSPTSPVDLSSESSSPTDDKEQSKSTDELPSTPSLHPDDENQTKSHLDDNNQTMSTDVTFCTPSSHSGEDFQTTTIDHSSSSPSEPVHTEISTPAQESPSEGNSSQLGLIFGILLAFAVLTTASTAFFIFRRRKLQRQSRRQLEKTASTQREQEFEEFINDVYQSADPNLIQPLQNTLQND